MVVVRVGEDDEVDQVRVEAGAPEVRHELSHRRGHEPVRVRAVGRSRARIDHDQPPAVLQDEAVERQPHGIGGEAVALQELLHRGRSDAAGEHRGGQVGVPVGHDRHPCGADVVHVGAGRLGGEYVARDEQAVDGRRPAGVDRHLHDHLDQLLARHARVARRAQVAGELALAAERAQRRDRDQLALAQVEPGARPEVAVSVEYYVRLEQGRAGHASEGVLLAFAAALQCDARCGGWRSRSERPAWDEPFAREAQVGPLCEQVVVVVVVKDGEAVSIGDGGDKQVDGRKPMVADSGELALGIEGALLDVVVDVEARECEQLVQELVMVTGIARGVAGFEQERQARADVSGLEGTGELGSSLVRDGGIRQPDPRGVVEQQRRGHGRTQPARRTSSAAVRSAGTSRRRTRSASRRRRSAVSSR